MVMVVTALLVTPADARHRHRHHEPLSPRVEQPLTPRVDRPLKPRGERHRKPKPARQRTQNPKPVRADVPVPEPRPADAPEATEPNTQNPAATSDRFQEEGSPRKQQARPEPPADAKGEPEPPAVAPTPTQRPETAEPEVEPPAIAPPPPPKPADADKKEMLPDPRSADLPDAKMPAEEVACRERLRGLGVEFEEHKAESDRDIGCSIPYPLVLKSLGKSIAIAPGAELNCAMAEAAARFAGNVIQPAAKAEFGADLKSIGQASAFVCRPRNGTRKLSEHAFGNALDIASFTLADGRTIEVGPAPPDKDAKFLDAVRKAACGPFKTVLGPGSDADHSLHLHLDLEPRRHGGTFCQ
ncbi:extensin family protein [Mesorhizobium sp. B2-6-7]|nr:extensin family protein [Mesorhizobium sp. B2-6-7]